MTAHIINAYGETYTAEQLDAALAEIPDMAEALRHSGSTGRLWGRVAEGRGKSPARNRLRIHRAKIGAMVASEAALRSDLTGRARVRLTKRAELHPGASGVIRAGQRVK